MRIERIELVGFKRMSLNNIRSFTLTPTELIQLILGTNGSGKSSLMRELTPLPGNPSQYTKEGSKTIEITHHGNRYLLKSVFSPTQRHSFYKNDMDDNLNQGGTVTVQKELVYKEFGIRQDIHELICGNERFTAMSPSRRRHWLTVLCEENYDYAIGVYNKLAERMRDTSGALKLAKRQLVVETAKIVSAQELEKIQSQVTEIVREVELLYRSRADLGRSTEDLEADLDNLRREVIRLSDRLITLHGTFSGAPIRSVTTLEEAIDSTRHEITQTNTTIKLLTEEHGQLKEAHDLYVKSGGAGLGDLQETKKVLTAQRDELMGKRKLQINFADPQAAASALESIHETLVHIFTELPVNAERLFSQANHQAAKEKDDALKERIGQAEKRLEAYRHQKSHLDQVRNGDSTQCPKCSHKWYPGFDPRVFSKLVESIDEGGRFLETFHKQKEDNQKVLEENAAYGQIFREFSRCVRTLPVLQPLWDLLQHDDLVFTSPTRCLTQVEILRGDLLIDLQVRDLNQAIERNDHHIELAVKASALDMGKITTRLETVEKELGEKSQLARQLVQAEQRLRSDLSGVQELLKLGNAIEDSVRQLKTGTEELVKATRNEMIDRCLRQLQIELAQKQNILNDINMQKGIVEDIDKNIQRMTKEELTLKLLVSELSPTHGLIAEGLLGFIRNFVKKMNFLITKMWSYPLDVQDCGLENDEGAELDYKFPILIDSQTEPVPDISLGSTGIREVIDLAFKVVAMEYLGLRDHPLVLDELGAGFDAAHKASTVNLIKYLMEHNSFSQIYMVSHDYLQYSALSHLETCVLSPNNIVVPMHYNEHVMIS